MKKATSKRTRKYGDKEEVIIDNYTKKKKSVKNIKRKELKVIVDGGQIRTFYKQDDMDNFIDTLNKSADKSNATRPSFIFI